MLARASMLIFPSRGPESLSRVLLEASALGVPIAAMDTGGTRDIIEPGVTGLLASTPEGSRPTCNGCATTRRFGPRLAGRRRARSRANSTRPRSWPARRSNERCGSLTGELRQDGE